MRNWNCFGGKWNGKSRKVYILPMRNWNLDSSTLVTLSPRVYILPMRNWNYFSHTFADTDQSVYILPMRNWNAYFPGRDIAALACLYLTYEELKLWMQKRMWKIRFSLYLTYEELKPSSSSSLKLMISWFISYLWGIETLLGSQYEYFPDCSFISYLWGIETFAEALRISWKL